MAALHHLRTDERHRLLAAIVEHLPEKTDEAAVRLALRGAHSHHAAAHRQAVARPDRLEPLHLVDAGRAHRGGVEQQPVRDHAHHDAAGVPARRAEPAQHGVARGLLVEMHRLRIELRREADDLLARDTARPIFGRPVGGEIFQVILRHGRPAPQAKPFPRRHSSEPSTGAWPGEVGTGSPTKALRSYGHCKRCIDIAHAACSLAASRGPTHKEKLMFYIGDLFQWERVITPSIIKLFYWLVVVD